MHKEIKKLINERVPSFGIFALITYNRNSFIHRIPVNVVVVMLAD